MNPRRFVSDTSLSIVRSATPGGILSAAPGAVLSAVSAIA
jgi:hypothetical protein